MATGYRTRAAYLACLQLHTGIPMEARPEGSMSTSSPHHHIVDLGASPFKALILSWRKKCCHNFRSPSEAANWMHTQESPRDECGAARRDRKGNKLDLQYKIHVNWKWWWIDGEHCWILTWSMVNAEASRRLLYENNERSNWKLY